MAGMVLNRVMQQHIRNCSPARKTQRSALPTAVSTSSKSQAPKALYEYAPWVAPIISWSAGDVKHVRNVDPPNFGQRFDPRSRIRRQCYEYVSLNESVDNIQPCRASALSYSKCMCGKKPTLRISPAKAKKLVVSRPFQRHGTQGA